MNGFRGFGKFLPNIGKFATSNLGAMSASIIQTRKDRSEFGSVASGDQEKREMTHRHTYDRFAEAWASGDVDGCLAEMTSDAQYGASIGPEPGRTFTGTDELRQGIAAMIAHDSPAAIHLESWSEVGQTAFAEWRYDLGGGRLTLGIDRIDFRDGLIWRKQAYRKVYDDTDC